MRALVLAVCLAAATAASAAPATPVVVPHQGRLLDGSNTPVSSEISMKFQVFTTYDTLSSEKAIWEETYTVQVVDGTYAVLLGDTLGPNAGKRELPATVFAAPDRYLGITIGTTELKPRLRIGSVPFAYRAESAASADLAKTVAAGAIATAQLGDAAVTGEKIAANAVSTNHLGDGQVTLAKLSLTNGKFTGLNADLLDGLDSSAFAPAAIEGKVDQLLGDTNTLKADTLALKADTAALKADTTALKADTGTIKADTQAIRTDVAAVKTDVAGVKTDVAGVKTDVGAVKTDVGAVKTQLGTTDGKVDGVATKLANVESVVTASGKRWGSYSKTCVDAVAKGWNSIPDCLTDGRWHFYVNASGTALNPAGTGVGMPEFYAASLAGADTKMRMGEDWYDIEVRTQNQPSSFWVFLKDRNPLFSFVQEGNGSISNVHVHLSNGYNFDDNWFANAGDFGNRHHLMSGYSYRGARTNTFPLGGIDYWARY